MKTLSWLRGACVAAIVLFSNGCAHDHHRYDRRAYDTYYDYDYYPRHNVYYYPQGRVYYWNDDGRWVTSRRLPPRYELRDDRRERLRLRSREPWTEHHQERRGDQLWRNP